MAKKIHVHSLQGMTVLDGSGIVTKEVMFPENAEGTIVTIAAIGSDMQGPVIQAVAEHNGDQKPRSITVVSGAEAN